MKAFLVSSFVLAALALAGSATPSRADSLFVVLANFDAEGGVATFSSAQSVIAAAAPCNADAWMEYSGKFRGFRPGFLVVVIGPIPMHLEAEAILRRVRPCAPGAYIRSGFHLGE
jgi:hypothetical protein